MRIAIIGSRSITEQEYPKLCSQIPVGASEIISGGARGADALAERYAQEQDIPFFKFLPQYEKFGKQAPLKRNLQIIERADYVIALWDGTSRGTAQVIAECMMHSIAIKVILCHKAKTILENKPQKSTL